MRNFLSFLLMATPLALCAETITSPDGQLVVSVECQDGKPVYSISYQGQPCLLTSPLGLLTNVGDYTSGLSLSKSSAVETVTADYALDKIKFSGCHYQANAQTYTFSRDGKEVLSILFQVSDNNVAFRYGLLAHGETMCCVILDEATGFTMPDGTTTFICPQMGEMTGFARTAPSYETHYDADAPMGRNGWGHGYTFPCLFRSERETVGAKGRKSTENVWTLISETGNIGGNYCGCKLENVREGQYKVAFPSMKENNGYGSNTVQAALPSLTPWRTLTIAGSLKPIAETTITWDVLVNDPVVKAIRPVQQNKARRTDSRGAWSWIIANDESCNYDTQRQYIDFASAMGWESLLIDAQWDQQIGRDRIAQLAQYGKSKGVDLYLWYNSNGIWNDAPQTPRNCMDDMTRRRQEMQWMEQIGIRGIKVDFFGGDKQCTLQLYHDILMEAGEHGLNVIFHGCTLPRGWEYVYPAYVASEAVRASENLHFSQGECDREAMDATFLPFIRNAVGSMDFGGSTLNWYYNPKNSSEMWGGHRITSDVFALATAILFQSPVQHFAMAPNNLEDAPAWAVDFMKEVPSVWDEIRYIDGYPGKYVILARRIGRRWYLAGVNAEKEPLKVSLSLDMFNAGDELSLYADDAQLQGSVKTLKVNKKRTATVTIPCNGGFVIR